jgi:hypothetical protein
VGVVIGRSLGSPNRDDLLEPDHPAASVVSLFATTHRWWKLAVDTRSPRPAPAALAGIAPGVVWRGSVVTVPCPSPEDGDAGPCACSLHAPAAAVRRARSLASVVVGGYVRVLSVDHDVAARPHAVVAVEGPLTLFAWCGGVQDGLSLAHCDDRPLWAVHAAGSSSAFCRRHLRLVPRRLRQERERIRDFEARAVAGLGRRYGAEVGTAAEEPRPGPAAVGDRSSSPSPAARSWWFLRGHGGRSS